MADDQNVKPDSTNTNTQPQPQVEVNIDYKDMYLRALADYKNLVRQTAEREKVLFEVATVGVINELLPVLDMLAQAQIFVQDEGLKMVKNQFDTTLKNIGLTELDLLNKDFDPHLAEVVATVPGPKDDIVVEIVKKGYKIGERIVRVASVKVSKNN